MKSNTSSIIKVRFREPYFLVGNMLLNTDKFIGKSFITQEDFKKKFSEDLPPETSFEITPEAQTEIERLIKSNLKL